MPRRIPGAQSAFTCKFINNDYRSFAQINNQDKKTFICFLSLTKDQQDKRKSRKGESFGQCLRMGYDLLYTHCFAFASSGNSKGIVDQVVVTKAQVSLCPKGDKVKFNFLGQIHVPHFSVNRKADRAFNKTNFKVLLNQNFYNTTCNNNCKNLLRNECRDSFDTVESWHQTLKAFDNKIKSNTYISNDPELTKEANKLILNYFYLVSKLMQNNKKETLISRVLTLNTSIKIERLQCLFIESTAARYYSVEKVSKSSNRFTPGVDKITFLKLNNEYFQYKKKQLKGTRYNMSGKNARVKKDVPKKAILTDEIKNNIKQRVNKHNNELKLALFKKCDTKTYRENYKGDSVNRIWVPKPQSVESQPLGIPTLRDRVLQTILHTATHPIIKYQSNYFNRPASSPIALLTRHLKQLEIQKNLPVKTLKSIYAKFKGRRSRKKMLQIIPKAKKRRRKYLYQHCKYGPILPVKDQKTLNFSFKFFSNYHLINGNIFKYFDNINNNAALKIYPICNKYRYFIKAWLNASIYKSACSDSVFLIRQLPKDGIFQGSIIGSAITNCILNELNKSIENVFRKKKSKYLHSLEKLKVIEKYSDKKLSKNRILIDFLFLHSPDDILILSKSTPEVFETVLKILKKELKKKN